MMNKEPDVKISLICCGVLLLGAGLAHAEQAMTCRGTITSKQGEGLRVRTFRFEVDGVTGSDVADVLEKSKKIAQQRQNRAARSAPGVPFQRLSELDLQCTRGAEKFTVQRVLATAP